MVVGDKDPTGTRWKVFGSRSSLQESAGWTLEFFDVETPGGARFEHHVLRMQRVAVVLVIDDAERLLMLRRHRFIDDSWGWEVPVGIVEPTEEPMHAALREVREETGWVCQRDRANAQVPASHRHR